MITNTLIRKLYNDSKMLAWLQVYAMLTLVQSLTLDRFYQIEIFFFNGGILLVALLDLTRNGFATKLLIRFFLLVFGLDWLVKSVVVGIDAALAANMSLTVVMQGYLGWWLLWRTGLNNGLPDTPKKIVLFAWLAAIMPVIFSSVILLALNALAVDQTIRISLKEEFLWWFMSRLTSVVLVSPVLLLCIHQYSLRPKVKNSFFGKEFWLIAFAASICSFIIFSVINPLDGTLSTYSYLLLPVMLVSAVRLPMFKSLMVLLLVSIICFWADSTDYQTPEQSRSSFMALSLFLMITSGITWLVGALIEDRTRALAKERAQSALYEMLSRVNQTIVKENLDKETLFKRVCNIILEESNFTKALILSLSAKSSLTNRFKYTKTEGISQENIQCKFIDDSIREKNPVVFKSCDQCNDMSGCAIELINNCSLVAFPINRNGNIIAVLVVSAGPDDEFYSDDLRLLQEMADNIGFANVMYEERQRLNQVGEVFHHSRESIIITDKNGTILNVNPSFSRITGFSREETLGTNPRVLKSGKQSPEFYHELFTKLTLEGFWSGQFWNKRKNGDLYLQRGTISSVKDERGEPKHYIAVMEDASSQNEAEQKIHSLANYDQLTGLPNRTLLSDRFQQILADAKRQFNIWCLMFIDLDDFKQVNDALGHHIGDELLKDVSRRIRAHIRDTDTLCRFGGDEFILLMRGGSNEAAELATRLVLEVSRTCQIEGIPLQIGASIGISILFQDGNDLDELIQASDTAMYQAKNEGRGCFKFFSKTMQNKVQHRLELKQAINKALNENEFCLFYQPIVTYTKEKRYERVGYEALVRWNDPSKGIISPASFIPAAEDSGQISEIDHWVLKNAIGQLKIWLQQDALTVLPVAINLSAKLFSKASFVEELSLLLSTSGVPPHLIELEITEHVSTHDIEKTLATLNALKKLGVGLSIDDFGTGYSSLSYLQRFPIDYLKIDMSFIRNVHCDSKKQGLVKAIISMANALNIKTIAEGIEVEEELEFLFQNGCDQYQGYYFGKPAKSISLGLDNCSNLKIPVN